jgi:outer membrane protein
VYIDTGRLYQNFLLSKELNEKLKAQFENRKAVLDSLYNNLQAEAQRRAEGPMNKEQQLALTQLRQTYLQKQEEFEKENREETMRCERKIWNQVNQYLIEFGKNEHYNFILGANGDGNIMYANTEIDITGEVTTYLNKRYNGEIN